MRRGYPVDGSRRRRGRDAAAQVSLLDGAKPEDNVIAVAMDAPVDSLVTICAVGCVPHQNPCLTATTMNKGLFVSTGHREGAALEI